MKLPLIVCASPSRYKNEGAPIVVLKKGRWRFEHNCKDSVVHISFCGPNQVNHTDEIFSETLIDLTQTHYVPTRGFVKPFLFFVGSEAEITVDAILME